MDRNAEKGKQVKTHLSYMKSKELQHCRIKGEEEGEEIEMPPLQASVPQLASKLPLPPPETQSGMNAEVGEASGREVGTGTQGGGQGVNLPLKPIPLHPPPLSPIDFNSMPSGGQNLRNDLSTGESLSPEEQASALAQVDALERQLASLDQSNKADPAVSFVTQSLN